MSDEKIKTLEAEKVELETELIRTNKEVAKPRDETNKAEKVSQQAQDRNQDLLEKLAEQEPKASKAESETAELQAKAQQKAAAGLEKMMRENEGLTLKSKDLEARLAKYRQQDIKQEEIIAVLSEMCKVWGADADSIWKMIDTLEREDDKDRRERIVQAAKNEKAATDKGVQQLDENLRRSFENVVARPPRAEDFTSSQPIRTNKEAAKPRHETNKAKKVSQQAQDRNQDLLEKLSEQEPKANKAESETAELQAKAQQNAAAGLEKMMRENEGLTLKNKDLEAKLAKYRQQNIKQKESIVVLSDVCKVWREYGDSLWKTIDPLEREDDKDRRQRIVQAAKSEKAATDKGVQQLDENSRRSFENVVARPPRAEDFTSSQPADSFAALEGEKPPDHGLLPREWMWPDWTLNTKEALIEVYVSDDDRGEDRWCKAQPRFRVVDKDGLDAYLCAEYEWDGEYYVQDFGPHHVRKRGDKMTVFNLFNCLFSNDETEVGKKSRSQ